MRLVEGVTEKKIEHLIKAGPRAALSPLRNVQLVWRFRVTHTPHSGTPRAPENRGQLR